MDSSLSFPEMKELTTVILRECYAQDILEVSEYERRLTVLNQAGSKNELDSLIRDLPIDLPAVMKKASTPLLHKRRSQNLSLFFGDKKVSGERLNCRYTDAIVAMGDLTFDFRDIELPPGTTTLKLTSIMADTKIIVPPELYVDTDLTTFMGSVREPKDLKVHPAEGEPVLRITGLSVMSEVKIKIKELYD